MTGVPLLSLQGALQLKPQVDPLQNEPLVQMWLEIKMKPLLKSITRGFLSCLSTKKFSCSTYQTVYVPVKFTLLPLPGLRSKLLLLLLQGEGAEWALF